MRTLFANQLGLTTQVPALYEVYTNKATTEYRETKLANLRVIIRKPYCEINTENVATLQFLDLIKEVVDISEVDGEELTNRLIGYMKKKNIKFEKLRNRKIEEKRNAQFFLAYRELCFSIVIQKQYIQKSLSNPCQPVRIHLLHIS